MKDIEIEKLRALSCDLKKWHFHDENIIEKLLIEFEEIPRLEWSQYRIDVLSDSKLAEELILIGEKFSSNQKILRNVISSLGNMVERYNLLPSDILYEFFVNNLRNKKVNFYIALFITKFPQFEADAKKWEIIMSIPKITPKKESRDIFYKEIKQRMDELPMGCKKQVEEFFKNILQNDNISSYTEIKYQELLQKLKT
jgi:hypothetical protein